MKANIDKDRIIDLTVRSANVFFEAIENPPAPNKKLKEAIKAYKETLQPIRTFPADRHSP